MWDLNDSPDQIRGEESLSDNKGKRVGSQSNSSSSAVVIEEGSEEEEEEDEEGERTGGRKRSSSAIFGFSGPDRDDSRVTRQFFPVEDQESGTTPAGGSNFPRAHWVGVKFCQSDHLAAGAVVVAAGAQPLRKSRRGPRSRSSQYRGVTFYRRTGRWESHIWFVPCFCCFFFFFFNDNSVVRTSFARINYFGGPISLPTCGRRYYIVYVTGLWTSNTISQYRPKY